MPEVPGAKPSTLLASAIVWTLCVCVITLASGMLPGVGASCVLSAPAISRVTASVGNKVVYTWTAGAWSGTYTVSGYAWNYYSNSSRWYSYQVGCGGTPAHTALGTQSGLTVDLAGRRLTWRPRTTALLGDWDAAVRIRAEGPASGGGYLRTAYVWVRLTATAACGTTAYAADRRSIALYTASPAAYGYGSLALETYALGDGGATYGGDGDVGLAFRYDYTPAGCAYYLEYEVATTWKATGASVGATVSTPLGDTWAPASAVGAGAPGLSWQTLVTNQAGVDSYVRVNSANVAHEGLYLVTVRSRLYDEDPRGWQAFTFELYLHRSRCVHADFQGQAAWPNMVYEIHPAPHVLAAKGPWARQPAGCAYGQDPTRLPAPPKCGRCDGDCDTDADCQTGLQCYLRAGGLTPGCAGTSAAGWGYCFDPTYRSTAVRQFAPTNTAQVGGVAGCGSPLYALGAPTCAVGSTTPTYRTCTATDKEMYAQLAPVGPDTTAVGQPGWTAALWSAQLTGVEDYVHYEYRHTENHGLLGVWTVPVTITLKDFPEFSYWMQHTRTFTVTITSACEHTKFTVPAQPPAHFYTLDPGAREILALDTLRDDISKLAVDAHGRARSVLDPATGIRVAKEPFCGPEPQSLWVNTFAPTVVDTTTDPTGRTTTYDLDLQVDVAQVAPYAVSFTDDGLLLRMSLARGVGYERVGVYKIQTHRYIRLFPKVTVDVHYVSHVLYPCENINLGVPAGIGGVFYDQELAASNDTSAYYVGAPAETQRGQSFFTMSEWIKWTTYKDVAYFGFTLASFQAENAMCGPRRSTFQLCDQDDDRREIIEPIVTGQVPLADATGVGFPQFTLEATREDEAMVGSYEFCQRWTFPEHPSFRPQAFQIDMDVRRGNALPGGGLPGNRPPVWSSPAFAALQDGGTLKYKQGDPVNLVYAATDPDDPTLGAKWRTSASDRTTAFVIQTASFEYGTRPFRQTLAFTADLGLFAAEEGNVNCTFTFYADDGAASISKTITLVFVRDEEEIVEKAANVTVLAVDETIIRLPKGLQTGEYSRVPEIQAVEASADGRLLVRFNQPMLFDEGLVEAINGGTPVPPPEAGKDGRTLTETDHADEALPGIAEELRGLQKLDAVLPALRVTYSGGNEDAELGTGASANALADWKAIDATGDGVLELQLNFTRPVWVGAGGGPCTVDLYFGTGDRWKGAAYGAGLRREMHYRVVLPALLPEGPGTDALAQAAAVAKYGVFAVAALAPTFGISRLWCMVEGLQLFVHYPLLLISASANVAVVRDALRPVATLAVVPDWILKQRLWGMREPEEADVALQRCLAQTGGPGPDCQISTAVEASGYGSRLIQITLGVPIYLLGAMTLLVLPLVLLAQHWICVRAWCTLAPVYDDGADYQDDYNKDDGTYGEPDAAVLEGGEEDNESGRYSGGYPSERVPHAQAQQKAKRRRKKRRVTSVAELLAQDDLDREAAASPLGVALARPGTATAAEEATEVQAKSEETVERKKAFACGLACLIDALRRRRDQLTWNFYYRYFYVLTLEVAICLGLGIGGLWSRKENPVDDGTSPYVFNDLSETASRPWGLANLILVPVVAVLYVLFLAKLVHLCCKDGWYLRAREVGSGALYGELDYENYPMSKAAIGIFISKRAVFALMCLLQHYSTPGLPYTTPEVATEDRPAIIPSVDTLNQLQQALQRADPAASAEQYDRFTRVPLPEAAHALPLRALLVPAALAMSVASMAFLAHRNPYVSKVRYGLECMNEAFFYLSILGLQAFYGRSYELTLLPEVRYNLGWIICALALIYLLIHVGTLIIVDAIVPLRLYIKVTLHERKLAQLEAASRKVVEGQQDLEATAQKWQLLHERTTKKRRTRAELSRISEVDGEADLEEEAYADGEKRYGPNQVGPGAENAGAGALLLNARAGAEAELLSQTIAEPTNEEVLRTLLDDQSAVAELRNAVLAEMRVNNPEQFASLQLGDIRAIDEAVGGLVTDLAKQDAGESTARDGDTATPSLIDTRASQPQGKQRKTRKAQLTAGLGDLAL